MMKFFKKYWGIFMYIGIIAFVCAIAIFFKGEIFLRDSVTQVLTTGNMTPDVEGVIIGAYGVHSTVAYGLLAISIALFSIGMVFYNQVSTEKQIQKLLDGLDKIKYPRILRVVGKRYR